MDSFLIQLHRIEQSFDTLIKDMKTQTIVLSPDHVQKISEVQEKLCQLRTIDTYNQIVSGVRLKDLGNNWVQGEQK